MFRVLAMRQLRLVVLRSQARDVLQTLGRLGAVEFMHTNPGPGTAPLPAPDHTDELKTCANLLSRLDELQRRLEIPELPLPGPGPPHLAVKEVEGQLTGIERRAAALLEKQREKRESLKILGTACGQLLPFCGIGIPLENQANLQFVQVRTGRVPLRNYETLAEGIDPDVLLLRLPVLGTHQPLVALSPRSGRAALEKSLDEAGFEAEVLPNVSGMTVDSLATIKLSQRRAAEEELQDAREALRNLAQEIAPVLSRMRDAVRAEVRLLEAEGNFPRTEATLMVEGWVPAEQTGMVQEKLTTCTQGRYSLQTREPEGVPTVEIPVLLRPGKFLQPFAALVQAYGVPNYHEVEPTVFVAASYLLMFGMMFGDAGHGAVLATVGLGLLLRGGTEKIRNAAKLLLGGGLASIAFGVLYGSFFGLPQFKKYAFWHEPLEADPLLLIGCALRFGVLLMSVGLVLNIINRLRRGDLLGGLLDKFGVVGLVFYWGLLALLTHRSFFEANGLTKVAWWVFLGLPLVGWCLKEPINHLRTTKRASASNFGAAIAESMVSAFEALLSYLANTISFVRLAAYAMSHSALLLAVVMMAAELKKAGVIGGALGVLVIAGGNLLALALEGVIASVQALRLEYYEFFSKFFAGDGRAFQPFRLN